MWNKDFTSSSFQLDDIQYPFVTGCSELVQISCVPVFVSLCTCSKFFNTDEMNMENSVGRLLANELMRYGVYL